MECAVVLRAVLGAMEVDWLGRGEGEKMGGQDYGDKVNYRSPGSQQLQALRPLQVASRLCEPPVVCMNCGGSHWIPDCPHTQSARRGADAGTTGRAAVRLSGPNASR
eukprot:16452112-Heterocapsa_arctica.AAC.1